MRDQVIQLGIDLGTTNSSISITNKGKVEVIKNSTDQMEYTPSVFGIDKAKNKLVGKKAYDKLFIFSSEDEVKNNVAEIKRLMGEPEKIHFPRIDESFTPEEISAEILKSLKESVLKKYPDFSTDAAVITVPAHFSHLQSEATKRAGNLAGFKYVVLLQEPIAAAIAYGFDSETDSNWLVYDLGGGTFDTALVSLKDGVLSVREHGGDNFLGGKDMDWLIVDSIILPALQKEFKLKNFTRGNKKFEYQFNKLKYFAESAKIYLSNNEEVKIEIDGLGKDESDNEIYFVINFTREQLNKIIDPLLEKTIKLSKEVIKKSGIDKSKISKVVLVGGPTQIPYLREKIKEELGINVDTSVDPLTVVSQGAALYALGQRIPEELVSKSDTKANKGQLKVKINYEPLTSDTEQMITGIVEGATDKSSIQIQSDNGEYTSAKIQLKNGKFFDTVLLENKGENLFWIYLFDEEGNSIPVTPDSFSITRAIIIDKAPLAHTIGVKLAKKLQDGSGNYVNTYYPIFKKNSRLPLKTTQTFYTPRSLNKTNTDNVLPIDLLEGESEVPERNDLICHISLTRDDVPYDLPAGTEVDVTVEVDESREVKLSVYVPTTDQWFNVKRSTYTDKVDLGELSITLEEQKNKLGRMKGIISEEDGKELEDSINSISKSIESATYDDDEKRKASKELNQLQTKFDALEQENEFDVLVTEFKEHIEAIKSFLENVESPTEKEKFNARYETLREEGEQAIKKEDKELLRRCNDQLLDLGTSAFYSNSGAWVYRFNQLADGTQKFKNDQEATYFINKGRTAIEVNDLETLKRCVLELIGLLPEQEQQKLKSSIAGITNKQ